MQTATYARVSSDQQEHEATVQSQLAELRTRMSDDHVTGALEFVDEGYARDNLVRPGLDRLRDLVARGEVDRVFVQAPDRLASGAKLVVLVEEFQANGAHVIFLKGAVEDTPEGKLLLHMQGAIAEFERTKISERTRRGKQYWARQGALVGGHAPYGFRFVRRVDQQRAHLVVDDSVAPVVREMFRLLVEDGLSTRAIARLMMERGVTTARGAKQWQPHVVARMLRNPAYKGTMMYFRTQRVVPEHPRTTNRYQLNRKSGSAPRPEDEWVPIPVPPIVDEHTWQQAQNQLDTNARFSRRNNTRRSYLLRGLIRCPRCGGTYVGQAKGGRAIYRCGRTDWAKSSTGERCAPGSVQADLVEQLVWNAVTDALGEPHVLRQEYERRLTEAASGVGFEAERKQVEVALKRIHGQEDRLTDAYLNEAVELPRFKDEMVRLQGTRHQLERALGDIRRREGQQVDVERALGQLEAFCEQVTLGLEAMTFEERQQLLRLLVEKIIIQDGVVRIETVVPPAGGPGPEPARLPGRPGGPGTAQGTLRSHHSERSEESLTLLPARFSRRPSLCGTDSSE